MKFICTNPECAITVNVKNGFDSKEYHCPSCDTVLISHARYSEMMKNLQKAEHMSDEEIHSAQLKWHEAEQKSSSGILERVKKYVLAFYELLRDPSAKRLHKAYAAFAILYIVSPIDVIPDVVPIVGFIDDYFIVISVIALIGTALAAYMGLKTRNEFSLVKCSKPLVVLLQEGNDQTDEEMGDYDENEHARLWRLSRSGLEKCRLNVINEQVYQDGTKFMRHPILPGYLVGMDNFDEYVLNQQRREMESLITALGATETKIKYFTLTKKNAKGSMDMHLVNALNSDMSMQFDSKQYALSEKLDQASYDNPSVNHELPIIDELIWLLVGNPDNVKQLCYKRIVGGQTKWEFTDVFNSEKFISIDTKAGIKKLASSLKASITLSESIGMKVEYQIAYAPLTLPSGISREDAFEGIKDRIERRIQVLNGSQCDATSLQTPSN